MLEYEQKRYSNGGMQQQMRRKETYCSSNGYRRESELSQMQLCAPPKTGLLNHGSHPHKTSGYGQSHSSGQHSSGGGLMSRIGTKLNPAKFSSWRPHHQHAGEYETEHVYYDYQSLPWEMHKERYEISYGTQGAGMGHGTHMRHGTGNYAKMSGTQEAEWVSTGL